MAKKTKKTLILKRKHGRLNRKSLGKCKKTFFFTKKRFSHHHLDIVKFVAQETTRPDNTQHTKNSQNHYNA